MMNMLNSIAWSDSIWLLILVAELCGTVLLVLILNRIHICCKCRKDQKEADERRKEMYMQLLHCPYIKMECTATTNDAPLTENASTLTEETPNPETSQNAEAVNTPPQESDEKNESNNPG